MITDRTYLVAGSIAHRLNESLPQVATLLETDLDVEREGVHVRVQVGNVQHYSFVEEKAITSEIDRSPVFGHDRFNSPRKAFEMNAFMSDTTWAQFVCDYITSEVEYIIALGSPNGETYPITPTINDLAKIQAESEGYSLA